MIQDSDSGDKEADLLCGDSIVNYKTVQSFGHEDQIIAMYEKILAPNLEKQLFSSFKTGLALGSNQLIMYSVIAGFFWIGAELVNYYPETILPSSVMSAILILMFGAMTAGGSASSAPDMGRANASVDKVFGILNHESTIDAVADDTDVDKVRLDITNIKGHIEFEDVWFRYPTRKEDFVLRGLTLKVEPGTSCALVGESGCGKSTFINLVMRFYDPAHGRVLLDGIDISTINLHDLRTAISLVMQEPNIFNFNIMENILYGKLDATNTQVLAAAKLSNCVEFIEKKEAQKSEGQADVETA